MKEQGRKEKAAPESHFIILTAASLGLSILLCRLPIASLIQFLF